MQTTERNDTHYSRCRGCGVRLDYGKAYCGGGRCLNLAKEADDYRTPPDESYDVIGDPVFDHSIAGDRR